MRNKIRQLEGERDHYRVEAEREKDKNRELEKEFIVLRSLIADTQKSNANHETLLIKSQYEQERSLRIAAEADVGRLRQ